MRRLLPGLAAGLIMALAVGPAPAQPHSVRLAGWVQWIAGEKVMLVLNDGSGIVPVDLVRVPLDDYRTLTQRDQVVVIGLVSEDSPGRVWHVDHPHPRLGVLGGLGTLTEPGDS